VPPTWSLIVSHIPPADRGAAQAGYQLACSRVGPFSWSQRIQVGETTRSILVLGETFPLNGWLTTEQADSSDMSAPGLDITDLYLQGYVIDLTEFRFEEARAAATEAVQSSARRRAVIEQAKGVLMLAFALDADAAFALLVWHSQRSNRKVHTVAADVMAHVHEDELSGQPLRTAIDRILANGKAPRKRRPAAVAKALARV
jgi:hypothetical protein